MLLEEQRGAGPVAVVMEEEEAESAMASAQDQKEEEYQVSRKIRGNVVRK